MCYYIVYDGENGTIANGRKLSGDGGTDTDTDRTEKKE